MKFNVEVADAKTGRERIIQIEALSATDAERVARHRGLLVSAVHETTVRSAVEKLDEMVATTVERRTPELDDAPPTLHDHHPGRFSQAHAAAPNYREIARGSSLLSFYGALLEVVGALCLVLSVALLVLALAGPILDMADKSALVAAEFTLIVTGLGNIVAGVLLKMFGSLALAVRDIACNSFR